MTSLLVGHDLSEWSFGCLNYHLYSPMACMDNTLHSVSLNWTWGDPKRSSPIRGDIMRTSQSGMPGPPGAWWVDCPPRNPAPCNPGWEVEGERQLLCEAPTPPPAGSHQITHSHLDPLPPAVGSCGMQTITYHGKQLVVTYPACQKHYYNIMRHLELCITYQCCSEFKWYTTNLEFGEA